MISIIIADDQMLIREGFRTIVEIEEDMKVVGLASNGIEACELAARLQPDLVMMDIQMPEMDGITAIKRIKQSASDTQILILSTFLEDQYIIDGLTSGASGYILKDIDADKLLAAIRDTVAGQFVLPSAVAAKLASQITKLTSQHHPSSAASRGHLTRLTGRERDIAQLMIEGLSNRDIAAALYISEGTVRNYISNIYSKIDIFDRVQAIAQLRKMI